MAIERVSSHGDPDADAGPRRFWWTKRIAAAVVAVLGITVGLWFWADRRADRELQAEIDRLHAQGVPILPADFDSPAVADEDNAAVLLMQAFSAASVAAVNGVELGDVFPRDPKALEKHLTAIGQRLQGNEISLALIRQARSKSGVNWGIRVTRPVMNMSLSHLSGQRKLALLVGEAARDRHLRGDDAGAVEMIRDMLAIARAVEKSPALVSHLVAIGIDSLAVAATEDICHDLRVGNIGATTNAAGGVTPAAVRGLIAELLDIGDLRDGMVGAYRFERMQALDSYEMMSAGQMGVGQAGAGYLKLLRPMNNRDSIHVIRGFEVLANAGGESSLPAAESRLASAPPLPTYQKFRVVLLLYHILQPAMARALNQHFMAIADRRMAGIALAIRLYEIDHGRRPGSLKDLVPDYLPEVPLDPFTEDEPIVYRPDGKRALLWCRYPLGYDEDGEWILNERGQAMAGEKGVQPFFLNGDRPLDPRAIELAKTRQQQDAEPDTRRQDQQAEDGQEQPEQ